MFILNTPIPSKYIIHTLADWIKQLLLKPIAKHRNSKLHFVYFSYQPDFNYLLLSLSSLYHSVDNRKIGNVFLFEDQKAPFTLTQLSELKMKAPHLVVKKIDNFEWASAKSTYAEIMAYQSILPSLSEEDVFIKVDSDILFFKNSKLERLLHGHFNCFGDGHAEEYQFMQGGLYCFRVGFAKTVFNTCRLDTVFSAKEKLGSVAEDRVVSYLASGKGKIEFTRLMLFPSEYKNIKKLTRFNRWDFVAAHFVRDKDSMSEYQKRFTR